MFRRSADLYRLYRPPQDGTQNDTHDTIHRYRDIPAIRTAPIRGPIEIEGPAMTKTVDAKIICAKTVSIYAAQVLLGAIAIAAGAAKLSGTGLLVDQFHMLGIG